MVSTQQLLGLLPDDRLLSSLNFLLLWRIGRTWGSMVRQWHKKSESMLGMSEAVHAKASRCRVITLTIWSCASWLRDLPNLNFLPPISLSSTSSAVSGRSSWVTSAQVTPSPPRGWLVTVHTPIFVFRLLS